MKSASNTPKVRPDLSWTDLDDGGIVFDSSRDKIHSLNASAAYVWTLADGSRSVNQIARELSQLCQEPFEKVIEEVHQVLDSFAREGLLILDS